ncbi:MAG: dephospho-CoA kinase [Candidatus Hydrogenedentota bacterium]
MRSEVIGVTGLPCAGKTTLCNFLKRRLNAVYFSADSEIHRLFTLEWIKERIKRMFGDTAVVAGMVDRKFLASVCFEDKKKILLLEGLLHPYVIDASLKIIYLCRRMNKHLVMDVPLLFESRMNKLCDKIIFIRSSQKERIKRKSPLISIDNFLKREKRFINDNYKIDRANCIIYNDKRIDYIFKKVERYIDGRCYPN